MSKETACKNLNTNVVITTENGIKSVEFATDYRDFKNKYLDKPRYLDLRKPNSTTRPDELYSFNSDNPNNFVRTLSEIKTLSEINAPHIFDPIEDVNDTVKTDTYNGVKADGRDLSKELNKEFFIQIIEALQAYCKLTNAEPRFNYETFQKAIKAVDILYPKIYLNCAVFPSDSPLGVVGDAIGCAISGGKKIRKTRKTRKARKARKTRKNKRRRTRK